MMGTGVPKREEYDAAMEYEQSARTGEEREHHMLGNNGMTWRMYY